MLLSQLCVICIIASTCFASEALYNSLEPTSIAQHLAFYELYKDTECGKKALEIAWNLLSKNSNTRAIPFSFPQQIYSFITIIHPLQQGAEDFNISEEALTCIETITKELPNKQLKGHFIRTEDELLALSSEEIDLSYALFLAQFGTGAEAEKKRRSYDAMLDLMALQVLARLPKHHEPLDVVKELNRLIFYELQFRFPPHSLYSMHIDRFTFLPHILESRRGVCLGVATLYLCLAQRLNLPLEIVTPPGHIFVRYKDTNREVNIETTLRGVHIHTDEYLDINTRSLPTRSLKEVVGMAFFNQASIFLNQGLWQDARRAYERAYCYMKDDRLVEEFLGCCLLFTGEEEKGRAFLKKSIENRNALLITQDCLAEDLLKKIVDIESVKSLFLFVDETHASIVAKQQALTAACEKNPLFRSGLFQLAVTWLQLQQPGKAIEVLQRLHCISSDITVEYLLALLYFQRYNAPLAWKHYTKAMAIANKASYTPQALRLLGNTLAVHCVNQ